MTFLLSFCFSFYLTQNSSYIGIGPFNHGLGHNLNILYEFHILFTIYKILYVSYAYGYDDGFANIIIKKIIENIKSKNVNFLTFFSLLSFLFINIFL